MPAAQRTLAQVGVLASSGGASGAASQTCCVQSPSGGVQMPQLVLQQTWPGPQIEGPQAIAPALRELARPGDFVVFLGAGNITQWAYACPKELGGTPA